MPYIDAEERTVVASMGPTTPGQLNYVLTCALLKYLHHKGMNYTSINDCLGALEGAKLEFYRRVAAPYEETKAEKNGDVFDETS